MSDEASSALSIPASVGLVHQNPLGLALVLFGLYWLSKVFQSVDTSRPPLARSWIPWVGSAIEMGKDPDRFFASMTNLLGPMFRLKLLGQERIFVTSPSLISTIYRDSQSFDFLSVRVDIGEMIFSLNPRLGRQPYMLETYMPALHHALLPSNVQPMISAYISSAHDSIRSTVANMDGKSVPLLSLIIPPAYHAACHAAFGPGFPAEESYPLFRGFDDSFHLLATNIPRIFLSRPLKSWDKLVDLIEAYISGLGDDLEEAGHFVQVAIRGREAGWTNRDIAAVLGTQLWALQANAVFAAYWLVALQLQQKEGLAPLIEEIDTAREFWQATHPSASFGTSFFEDIASSSSKSLPLVTSAIQETLRYTSQTYSIRRVVKPVQLGGYELRPDEQVICVTRQTHVDDEVFPEASEFNFRRYVENPKAMKDGKLVPNHTMAFGGGVSMCEGRHFAMTELKMFVSILLTHASIELDPKSSSRPTFAWERQGIMHPRGDLQVIVKRQ
ncbi:cytochrome P450 [Cubamyces sp. BRFM 1775]|nr:cytochrome P450 [Cubamyces sp. BRFM 1775]